MLNNLNNVRKEKNVSLVDIADLLNVRYQTVADKINGKSSFKFTEALKIQEKFFPPNCQIKCNTFNLFLVIGLVNRSLAELPLPIDS
ncbi:hypothetical protein [Lactiplantibacillus plantarum]|uniref:hypothetical protein n=1 Tax=Lactiplantibacillus plantarum TaxID=1590 RepID=UPI003B9DF93B